jgi:hypothetical protein
MPRVSLLLVCMLQVGTVACNSTNGPQKRFVQGGIEDTDKRGHVVILPGISGPHQEGEVERAIEKRLGLSAQVWDWTTIPEIRRLRLRERLVIRRETEDAGKRLATELREWRQRNNANVYLLCGSGGASIAILACDTTESGTPMLKDQFFDKIIFACAAVSTSRSLKRTMECTQNGIYNYYSYNDMTLVGAIGYAIFGNSAFGMTADVAWPAAGRFGYRRGYPNFEYIEKQLGWKQPPGKSEWLDNNGKHMDCYDPEFLKTFFLPLFDEDAPVPDEWQKDIDAFYER